MSTGNLAPSIEVSEFAEFCEHQLSESLNRNVDIFFWDQGWSLVTDRQVVQQAVEISQCIREIGSDAVVPEFFQVAGDEQFVAIPLQEQQWRLLALAHRGPDPNTAWEQLIGLAQENVQLRWQLKAQSANCGDGFFDEETLFLSAVVQQLGRLRPDYAFSEVAEALLPTLAASIQAQSIAIVPEAKSSRAAFVAWGDPVGDLAEWERIVEICSQSNVESDVHRRVCGVGYSAIHNFVLAPIRMGDSLFGWIVADVDEGEDCPDLQARTTALMNASATILSTYGFADERLKQKEQLLLDVVRSLVSAIDAKDPQTCGHSVRVAIYASLVADALGLSGQECDELYLAGLLHDVGKIGIPEAIFQKDAALTEEEFELVKQHPDHGWKILHRLEDLQHILPGVVHHHESLDGSGYPDQISGEDIPLAARILAAVDAYDALTSERNYRKGKSHTEAMQVLAEGAGVQWDSVVVEAIHAKAKQIQRVSRRYRREAHLWRVPGSIEPRNVDPQEMPAGTTSRYDAFGVDRI